MYAKPLTNPVLLCVHYTLTMHVVPQDEVELDKDLNDILGGRRPRIVGELPNRMGNFVRLCPATTAHRHARRLRKRIIRPRPGEDNFDTYQ